MSIEYFKQHKVLAVFLLIVILAVIYVGKSFFVGNFSRTIGSKTIGVNVPRVGLDYETGGGSFGVTQKSVTDEAYLPSTAAGSVVDFKQDAKIIKTANLIMETEDIAQAVEGIGNIAKKAKGYVLNVNASENKEGIKRANITIKVPVATFDITLDEIKSLALFIANEAINTRDVTEEFADLESQLKNLRAEEQQYLEILKRAFTIKDTLEVTSKLSVVRGNIERIEGRIKFLESQTDFSTISVSLSEEGEVVIPTTKWRPLALFKQSAINTVLQLQGFVDNIVKFIFWIFGIVPYLIVLAVIYWIIKRRKKHN